ncbi:MAG: ribosomal protein S12 methylthiotransferase RimO [Omnitrophica bacterium RIFOXYB12_FULL_50_7]|nr:MAG: ribosomal protein S12 methylthiotransferase RimO [Omnitrophica bacterium RIFOXYB12_FULL_50_7]
MADEKKISVGIVSLGCPKTLVDSEVILGKVQGARYSITQDIEKSDVVLLNTCGFIRDAKEESIDALLKLLELKKEKKLLGVVVVGCLVQRYAEELQKEFPEVDAFIGSGDYMRIAEVLKKVTNGQKFVSVHKAGYLAEADEARIALTPKHFRYLKISEGCDHVCSFCVIPKLRGRYRSRHIADLVREAKQLVDEGAKELVVIGQDITRFGWDYAGKSLLPQLLEALGAVRDLKWIRLLYTYPSTLTDEMIRAIVASKKICRYIDLPLQHISDKILRAMRRGNTKKQITELIQKLRAMIPEVVIRTSFIVGFPGETDEDFEELLAFMCEMKFERLGIFRYSQEEGSLAAELPDQIPEKIKEERYHRAMQLQQEIAREVNRRYLGKELRVLVEMQDEKEPGLWTGRSFMDAPEVDGSVLIRTQKEITAGKFYTVKITDTQDYDLVGQI